MMTAENLLEELKHLTPEERLRIAEVALRLVREDLSQSESRPGREERARQLAAAAEMLREDYEADAELTAFTALDGEDVRAPG